MIYTITLNPALDRTLWIEKIKPDDSNRIEKEERFAGGKGIDVSRVLTTLGISNKALGFVGGFDGEELEGRLVNEGISCDFTRISGETRTNIVVNDIKTGNQTIFSARGPEIKPYELMQMIHKVEKIENPQIVIISGSLPPGIHPEIYRKIIEIIKSKGARVVLDTDGDALKMSIQSNPDIIKPNVHELSRLSGINLKGMGDIINTARSICEQGIGIILVSMGARGILLISDKEQYVASPPEVDVVNTIGAGDSAVAGFVYGIVSGKRLDESLVYAVAAGTATTLRPGSALCTRDDFLKLVPQVKLYRNDEILNPGL
jgi:6-phosphofructokinase 2